MQIRMATGTKQEAVTVCIPLVHHINADGRNLTDVTYDRRRLSLLFVPHGLIDYGVAQRGFRWKLWHWYGFRSREPCPFALFISFFYWWPGYCTYLWFAIEYTYLNFSTQSFAICMVEYWTIPTTCEVFTVPSINSNIYFLLQALYASGSGLCW